MIATLLSFALLTSVEVSPDGNRVDLRFDAPVAWSQSMSASPARIIIEIPGAGAAPGVSSNADWARAGLTLAPGAGAEGAPALRFEAELPPGATARAQADGATLSIQRTLAPLLLEARPMQTASGGIAVPDDASSSSDYLIGPEDLLEVNVFELPELKTSTRVLGDGTVSLPLLGVIQAAGRHKTGLEARLQDLLEDRFLLDPQVTISRLRAPEQADLRDRRGREARTVPDDRTAQRAADALRSGRSHEGGRRGRSSSCARPMAAQAERIVLDLQDLIVRGNPALNISMRPGDVVNIPVDDPIYVFVDGAVTKPGQVESTLSRPITLLHAIARAGGLTERANLKGVHVLRKAGRWDADAHPGQSEAISGRGRPTTSPSRTATSSSFPRHSSRRAE